MTTSLVMQATYEHLEIGLFTDDQQKDRIQEDKRFASKFIITDLDSLLKQNDKKFSDISFIAVNQGPAPFTSLRVIISTVNGLSFASGIPLIGIDGLSTFIQEYHSNEWPYTIALFNAFNNDVYFGIETPEEVFESGYASLEIFLTTIKQKFPHKEIRFIGDGSALFRDHILATFGNNAYFPVPLPHYPSLTFIQKLSLVQWYAGHKNSQILPLYLKRLHYKTSVIPNT
jgi:tRNA threonylcarbamoyl adenosine modification protein YeaZ